MFLLIPSLPPPLLTYYLTPTVRALKWPKRITSLIRSGFLVNTKKAFSDNEHTRMASIMCGISRVCADFHGIFLTGPHQPIAQNGTPTFAQVTFVEFY